MAHEKPDEFGPPLVTRQRGARRLLIAGVAGACGLGAALGLWARPEISERRAAAAYAPKPEAAAPKPRIEIVVDDAPAPLGPPIEVLPATRAEPFRMAPPLPPIQVDPLAPARPPEGLVRVQDVVQDAAPIAADPPPGAEKADSGPEPRAAPKPAPKLAAKAAAPPRPAKAIAARTAAKPERRAKVEKAKEPVKAVLKGPDKPKARPEKLRVAKAQSKKLQLAKAQPKAGKSKKQVVRLAKAELGSKALVRTPKAKKPPIRLAKLIARPSAAKARQPQPRVRTAQAPPRAAKPTTRPDLLAHLEQVVAKAAPPATPKAAPAPKPVEAPKLAVAPAPAPAKPRASPPVRRAAPARLASASRCASEDPGAALACADPVLDAAERRLNRAYRQAQAAGVPEWRLQRQQQRWLAARSAAAREAPWAVRDVYHARTAELNDMAREAEQGDY